jgi:hypothetical protein
MPRNPLSGAVIAFASRTCMNSQRPAPTHMKALTYQRLVKIDNLHRTYESDNLSVLSRNQPLKRANLGPKAAPSRPGKHSSQVRFGRLANAEKWRRCTKWTGKPILKSRTEPASAGTRVLDVETTASDQKKGGEPVGSPPSPKTFRSPCCRLGVGSSRHRSSGKLSVEPHWQRESRM